ncbi:hypothetical protein [Streptomyces sp. NPDC058304]|uniref:hypothetical protein n=1 Tax=Streptomyces sp. NPDC058304 TaxID=3346437 RepID=UPI0036E782D3
MTTIDVETTEPSDLPAPPGPLNQAITADQTVGPTALADFVRQAMAELPAIAGADRATAHRYFDDFALRRRARHGPSGHRHGGHGTAGRDVRRRRRHGPAEP